MFDGMDGNESRCGDMGIEEEGKDGENARKICEMGVDWETLGYMVREEVKLDKLRLRGAKRAWGYEERLRVSKESKWARRCLREIEGKRARQGKKGQNKKETESHIWKRKELGRERSREKEETIKFGEG